jgi:hypothetical protein
MTFTKAVMQYFGKLPGQTTGDLAKEMGALSLDDKKDLATLLAPALGESVEVKDGENVLTFAP